MLVEDKNALDYEWEEIVNKLLNSYSRLRLSNEDEETIRKIVNKL